MIECAIDGSVAVVTLNNPAANTFTAAGLGQLHTLIGDLNSNGQVRAVVVTGQGEKFFSAGADLKEFADGNKVQARLMAQRFGAAFEALQEARPVTIAAINGYAMGGGLECALSCDMRVCEEHAQLALPEPSVGLLPCGCGTQTLPWLIGEGWAKRMILTGERVNADTALRIGLVEQVVVRGQALKVALELAKRVSGLGPRAVTYS
jgi:enoyl-CoA hydratase/carnithine racemase